MTSPQDTGQVDGALRSPEVARWALARLLRKRRRALGIPVTSITERLGLSRTRWSQIENDHHMIAAAMIPQLTTLLELDADASRDLQALRAAAGLRSRAWWLDYSDLLTADMMRYCGLEDGATSIRTFATALVNGLLQTPDYAYQIIANYPNVSEFDRKKILDVRMRRQQRLKEIPRLKLHAIMYEAVLHADFGSPSVLLNQLRHVLDLIDELPQTLQVLVLPFAAPPCSLVGSTIHLLDFARPELGTVVWDEALLGRFLDEDSDVSGLLSMMYDRAIERSLDREASRELIFQRIESLDNSR